MNDIKRLLETYENAAQTMKRRWQDIRVIIEGGYAPSKECAEGFQRAMEALRNAYGTIRAAAESESPEICGEDHSVKEYAHFMAQRRQEEARRTQNRKLLAAFAAIKAEAANYDEALAPYRKEAEARLSHPGDLSEDVLKGAGMFLAFLALEDPRSQEAEKLLEALDEYYPSSVVLRGLIFKKYTLPEDAGDIQPLSAPAGMNTPPVPAVETDASLSESSQEDHPAPEPEPAGSKNASQTAEQAVTDVPKAEPAAPATSTEQKKEKKDEKKKKKSRSSVLVPATREIKFMPPSASAFKSDVKSIQGADVILPLFTHLGALLEQQVLAFGIFMGHFNSKEKYLDASVKGSLEKLVNKNLLAAYDMDGNGLLVYCLTPYCYSCMQKNKIRSDRKFWAIHPGKVQFCGTQQMESEPLKRFTAFSAALMIYLLWAQENLPPRLYAKFRSSITWKNSYYTLSLRWKDEVIPCSLPLCLTERPLPEGNLLMAWEKVSDTVTDVPLDLPECPPENPPEAVPENGSVFCIRRTVLYRWNGTRWVTEKDGGDPEPPAPDGPDPDADPNPEPPAPETSPAKADGPNAAEETNGPDGLNSADGADSMEHTIEAGSISHADNPARTAGTDASNSTGGADIPNEDSNPDPVAVTPRSALPEEPGSLIHNPEDLRDYGVRDGMTARELASTLLKAGLSPKHVQVYRTLVNRLIAENRVTADGGIVENSIAQAAVLAKAMAIYHPFYQPDFLRLVLALDSRIEEHRYLGEQIYSLFEEDAGYPPVLKLMTILRALFAPDTAYDHTLRGYARSVFDSYEDNFPQFSFLKPLYSLFLALGEHSPAGFSTQMLRIFSDKAAEQNLLRQITSSAGKLMKEPRVYSGLKAMTPMLARCFGPGSDLRGCMEIIAGDRKNERELVQGIYREYLGSDENLSDEKIDAFFEKNWLWTIERVRAPKTIFPAQRNKVKEQIRARLNVMGHWLELTDDKNESDSKWFRTQRNQILKELDRVLPLLDGCGSYDQAVLQIGLNRLRRKLNGQLLEDTGDFADFLRTGVFCLDEANVPCLDQDLPVCRYYEPWRNALLHISKETEDLRIVLERISDPEDPLVYDNLSQAVGICQYLNEHCGETLPAEQYEEDLEATRRSAWESIRKFMGELESAFAYGRLSEFVKEDLRSIVYAGDQKPSDLLELFDERHNYGCLRALLDALRKIINEKTAERQMELQADIDGRKQTHPAPRLAAVLKAAEAKLAAPERNFVVAEEYINRFDDGIAEDMDTAMTPNTFLDFIGPAYDKLYTLCRENSSASLRVFGREYVERELRRRGVSSQYQNSALQLLRNMPNRPEDANPTAIMALLRELGFDVTQAESARTASSGMVRLSVSVRPDAKDKAEYAHPVDIMGTNMPPTLNVVCLFGRMQPNDIVDKICRLEMNRMALVFLNGPLDLQGRRQIAERFHKEMSGLNPFLLIDWVLLLYLAQRQRTERMPVMLSCTLPYTSSFQPFVENGSVSDEMFIGRKRELNKILDPNGPVIVYGGRQLGKTALLERAQKLANHPGKGEYAVLVRAGSMEIPDEAALTSFIIRELDNVGLNIPAALTIQELCQNLRQAHNRGVWTRLLLLIDESDKLLENFRSLTPAYRPVISLFDLTRATGNNFKFVFAGLHDVCAAANDPNTVFGQFGAPLIVKPLSAPEALELLSRPLRYLGFDIESARLEHLLVNTIFYPGIVHYVGYCLVQNLSTSYAKYYSAHDNPPYSLTDRQLGEIMSSGELNDRISKRIRWTLEVDPRYFMLARCVAYLYHEYPEQMKSGYSVELIREYAGLLDIDCLKDLKLPLLLTLLQELVDMGILVRPSETSFRLRQQRFLDIIGSREKIEADISIEQGGAGNV